MIPPRNCPFCGREPVVQNTEYTGWVIGCPSAFNQDGLCRFHPAAFNFSFKAEAIAKWQGGLAKNGTVVSDDDDEVPF